MEDETVALNVESEKPIANVGGASIIRVGAHRMRTRYWRQMDGEWVQTQLLPADPLSVALYFSKGFRAKPPTNGETEESISCPFCEFKPKNALSLRTHLNKHVKSEKGG